MYSFPWLRGLAVAFTCLIALPLVGCGESTGSVSGEVKLKGNPVAKGLISFAHPTSKRRVITGPIADGKYSVAGVPVGTCKIFIQPFGDFELPKDKDDKIKADKAKAKPKGKGKDDDTIPAKYADPKTSGLEFTVTAGENTYNIELE